eukprot:COSAG01_NODE_239_length_20670_cov_28.609790_4_plen_320_part_00
MQQPVLAAMARTVERNAQGVVDHSLLEEQGYCVVRGLISAPVCTALRAMMDRWLGPQVGATRLAARPATACFACGCLLPGWELCSHQRAVVPGHRGILRSPCVVWRAASRITAGGTEIRPPKEREGPCRTTPPTQRRSPAVSGAATRSSPRTTFCTRFGTRYPTRCGSPASPSVREACRGWQGLAVTAPCPPSTLAIAPGHGGCDRAAAGSAPRAAPHTAGRSEADAALRKANRCGLVMVRVRVEIMGSPRCRIVGRSQSVVAMIVPIIYARYPKQPTHAAQIRTRRPWRRRVPTGRRWCAHLPHNNTGAAGDHGTEQN